MRHRTNGSLTRHVTQDEILSTLRLLRPWTMRRNDKVRLGGEADGGYVVPRAILASDAVISMGIGHDASFDLHLAEQGISVLALDHTIPRFPGNHKNVEFIKRGWGPRTSGRFLALRDARALLKKRPTARLSLKFDVEGAEYGALSTTSSRELSFFDVVVGEFHRLDDLADRRSHAKMRGVFLRLDRTHCPVHLHANNYGGISFVEGVPIPKVIEVTYLRRSLDVFERHSEEPIPGPLDRPNREGVPDICLRPF